MTASVLLGWVANAVGKAMVGHSLSLEEPEKQMPMLLTSPRQAADRSPKGSGLFFESCGEAQLEVNETVEEVTAKIAALTTSFKEKAHFAAAKQASLEETKVAVKVRDAAIESLVRRCATAEQFFYTKVGPCRQAASLVKSCELELRGVKRQIKELEGNEKDLRSRIERWEALVQQQINPLQRKRLSRAELESLVQRVALLGLEESLMKACSVALLKDVDDRGRFDSLAVLELGIGMQAKIQEMRGTLSKAATQMKELLKKEAKELENVEYVKRIHNMAKLEMQEAREAGYMTQRRLKAVKEGKDVAQKLLVVMEGASGRAQLELGKVEKELRSCKAKLRQLGDSGSSMEMPLEDVIGQAIAEANAAAVFCRQTSDDADRNKVWPIRKEKPPTPAAPPAFPPVAEAAPTKKRLKPEPTSKLFAKATAAVAASMNPKPRPARSEPKPEAVSKKKLSPASSDATEPSSKKGEQKPSQEAERPKGPVPAGLMTGAPPAELISPVQAPAPPSQKAPKPSKKAEVKDGVVAKTPGLQPPPSQALGVKPVVVSAGASVRGSKAKTPQWAAPMKVEVPSMAPPTTQARKVMSPATPAPVHLPYDGLQSSAAYAAASAYQSRRWPRAQSNPSAESLAAYLQYQQTAQQSQATYHYDLQALHAYSAPYGGAQAPYGVVQAWPVTYEAAAAPAAYHPTFATAPGSYVAAGHPSAR